MNNDIDVIKNLEEKIQATISSIDICWKKFITSNIKEGMGNLGKIFGDVDYIISNLSIINKNLNVNSILNILVELEKSLNSKDYIFVSDLLKYEIKPILIKWDKELKNL